MHAAVIHYLLHLRTRSAALTAALSWRAASRSSVLAASAAVSGRGHARPLEVVLPQYKNSHGARRVAEPLRIAERTPQWFTFVRGDYEVASTQAGRRAQRWRGGLRLEQSGLDAA